MVTEIFISSSDIDYEIFNNGANVILYQADGEDNVEIRIQDHGGEYLLAPISISLDNLKKAINKLSI